MMRIDLQDKQRDTNIKWRSTYENFYLYLPD